MQVTPKAPAISALRCLAPDCGGLLAYEVDRTNTLTTDLSWTARSDGTVRFFPCPKCHGKNVLEEVRDEKGRSRQRVVRWQP
ncbi:MAG TPA: hypothetical protein VEB21_16455 [Terriglobales bacterium]|nr:hypothetical protein [Terriglobales bacterium]